MLFAQFLPAGLLLLAAAILTVLVLRKSPVKHRRSKASGAAFVRLPRPNSESGSAIPQQSSPQAAIDAANDLARAEVRLLDLEREISARLDTKMRALAHLVREGENTIARLEALRSELLTEQES